MGRHSDNGGELMRGQSSAEMLILVGAILLTVTSLFYLGLGSNESTVVMQAARDGTESAIANIDIKYGCSIDIENLSFTTGTITISVAVSNAPPADISWSNFRDNIVKKNIREEALRYIQNAVGGHFPSIAAPVKTSHYTYDVIVNARLVTK